MNRNRYAKNTKLLSEALRLHRAGVSYRKIGTTLGISRGSVYKVIDQARRAETEGELACVAHINAVLELAMSRPWRVAA